MDPLEPILDTTEGLDESIAGFYVEDPESKKFRLNVAEKNGFALENVAGLRETLADRKTKAAQRKEALAKFEGIDPEKARLALSKWEEIENWSPDEKAKQSLAAREAELKSKFEGDVNSLNERNTGLKTQLEKALIDAEAASAIAGAGGNAKLLLPHIKAAAQLVEVDGEYVVKIVGDNGNHRVTMKEGSSEDMGLAEYVELLSKDETYMPAFAGSGASGGGAGGSRGPGRSGNVESLTYAEAQDLGKYNAAKARAKERGVDLVVEPHPGWRRPSGQ